LNLELLSSILGQFIGVGVIAIVILFQQELRSFLIQVGAKLLSQRKLSIAYLLSLLSKEEMKKVDIDQIVAACKSMAKKKTGALIVLAKNSDLQNFARTGDIIHAETSSRLIESIFFKNSPLHDGAVIISGEKILAARCVLPISNNPNLPKNLGLRHRAALGMAEITDALLVIVSEQTGQISFAQTGRMVNNISPYELTKILEKEFSNANEKKQDLPNNESI